MENWYLMQNITNYNLIKNRKDFSSLQKIILANRDITDDYNLDTFLNPSIKNMHSPLLMKDMKKGVDTILEAMRQGKKILIVGDYDQDGVSATVILYKGLKFIYDEIYYAIPDRIEDGYGINTNIIDKAIDDGIGLVITCDNGIAALDTIQYAKDRGLSVIVTDHHEIVVRDGVEYLPNADAVINPHQREDKYPFKMICGALVAYKFIEAIQIMYGNMLGFDRKSVESLIQFAALGTICDMMPIVNENRIVVIEGLKQLNLRNNLGIAQLLNEINWNEDVDIYTVGFLIGPTINASGRIYTAKLGVELFLDDDIETVREYARALVDLNNERKKMTKDSVELAISRIDDENIDKNDIIVLYENSIHESICGLVAGRIKDRYNKPTIILTDSTEDGLIKGSGRSIKAYNMYENLNKFRDDYIAFGGHEMACGLTFEKSKLDDIYNKLLDNSNLQTKDFMKEIELDFTLKFNQIKSEIIKEIDFLEPYGFGFKSPIFATKRVNVVNASILGINRNVLRLVLSDGYDTHQAIGFKLEDYVNLLDNEEINTTDDLENLKGKYIDIAYKIGLNTFNGYTNIQLEIVSMR